MKTKFKDFLYEKCFPAAGSLFLHGLCRTLHIQTMGEEAMESLRREGQPIVFGFWHGRHFLLVHYMRHKDCSVVVSTSRDGTLIANILLRSGFYVVRGSSNRNPVRALVEAVSHMKLGRHISFTVDGPKGPIHQVKPGAIYLAKKAKAWLIPVTVAFRNDWKLKSWDRYRIPRPFTRALIVFDTPYRLSDDLAGDAIEHECIVLGDKLNAITEKADLLVKKTSDG
ncbi:lysophospholipid acyltransferase family protein [bacterium]|nr:lysophospholipid acyltransferase family protein [bacterium]